MQDRQTGMSSVRLLAWKGTVGGSRRTRRSGWQETQRSVLTRVARFVVIASRSGALLQRAVRRRNAEKHGCHVRLVVLRDGTATPRYARAISDFAAGENTHFLHGFPGPRRASSGELQVEHDTLPSRFAQSEGRQCVRSGRALHGCGEDRSPAAQATDLQNRSGCFALHAPLLGSALRLVHRWLDEAHAAPCTGTADSIASPSLVCLHASEQGQEGKKALASLPP
jgi:hypothetical protein